MFKCCKRRIRIRAGSCGVSGEVAHKIMKRRIRRITLGGEAIGASVVSGAIDLNAA